jgi:hypothetical protein
MKMSLDDINTLEIERHQIAYLETPAGKALIPQAKNWEEKLVSYYNEVMGVGFLPANVRMSWDDSDIGFYKEMFRRSWVKMLQVYKDDADKMAKLQSYDLPDDTKQLLATERQKLQDMETFSNYLGLTLSERWTVATPSPRFEPSQHLLEQLSLWGIHESDVVNNLHVSALSHH